VHYKKISLDFTDKFTNGPTLNHKYLSTNIYYQPISTINQYGLVRNNRHSYRTMSGPSSRKTRRSI